MKVESMKRRVRYLALGELALRRLLFPAEQRRDGDESAEDPHGGDHDDDALRRALTQVLDGVSDGPVAVETDETEVHYARGAQEHVDRGVDVAPPLAEHPVAHHLVGQRERHDDESQQTVGHRERADEPVLDALERALRRYGDDNEHVAADDHDHDERHENGSDDQTERRVAARVQGARPPFERAHGSRPALVRPAPVDEQRVVERGKRPVGERVLFERRVRIAAGRPAPQRLVARGVERLVAGHGQSSERGHRGTRAAALESLLARQRSPLMAFSSSARLHSRRSRQMWQSVDMRRAARRDGSLSLRAHCRRIHQAVTFRDALFTRFSARAIRQAGV